MAKRLWLVLALGLALIGARPALADVWDVATNSDNGTTTENDLVHGSDQIHGFPDQAGGAGDEDWYTVGESSNSSYQAVVDGTTGDIGGVTIERFDTTGSTSLQTGVAIGVGYSQSLAWDNAGGAVNEFVRVTSTACNPGGVCDDNDQYRIRFYDTSCAIARFNNSATQVTVMVIQNTTSGPVNGHYYLYSPAGVLLNAATTTFSLAANATLVRNTTLDAPGASGSITITNDTGYGAVAGKAVALEPATGFTFDTALSCRPH